MMRHALFAAIAIAVVSTALSAQVSPRPVTLPARLDSTPGTMAGCPGGNGIHISATGGTVTDSSSGTNTVIGLKQSVDTTLVFDISRKSWTRTDIAAAISLGIADQARGRYAICAGVAALIPSATLTIRGARGRVHFAASLKDFTNSLRVGPSQ
jgi:hypothetical protein